MAHVFLIVGTVIFFFGILGTYILPDILLRFHAATKCGVTGTINILIGLMIYSGSINFIPKLLLIFIFIFITSPLIAHILALSYFNSKKNGDEDEV